MGFVRNITFILLLLLGIQHICYSQSNVLSNINSYDITIPYVTVIKNEKSIVPSSIRITCNNKSIPYILDNTKLTLDTSGFHLSKVDTIHVFYRTFPIDFMAPYHHIDVNKLKIQDIAIPIESDFGFRNDERKNLFSKGLNYNGSFSRGISVGNSQSLVLNSQLNLQVNGDLGNGLTILAAISDDQIPIQPEGNTQILQEFDKVFIQVAKDKTRLTAGDYNLKSMPSKYSTYQKKMKGIKLEHGTIIKGLELSTTGSFAISKGKFIREKILNKEGNQGPYKLNANNTSNYLIVIAGSEKVFIDGKILERGESHDYVIDYNRAEILFTLKNIIDADKRIYVEYEYKDQSYLRSMYALQSSVKKGNTRFNVDFFREADSKSIASNEEIDSLDFIILQKAGDDLSRSIRSGISPIRDLDDSYTEYYHKIFVDSLQDSILVYTETPDSSSYLAFFSITGQDKGSYIIDQEARANGRVYKYVGRGNGSYDPIKQLVPPVKKQMLSLGAKIDLKYQTKVSAEISLSDFDNNRFSNIANEDNQGVAGLVGISKTTYVDTAKNWMVISDFATEYIGEDFNSINPFRNVEYSRDWNLRNTSKKTLELLNRASITVKNKNSQQIKYGLKSFVRKNDYKGLNHDWSVSVGNKKLGLDIKGSYLNAEDAEQITTFLRPNIDAYINLTSEWRLGSNFDFERLKVNDINQNQLLDQSKGYKKYGVYLKSQSIDNLMVQLSANRRIDQRTINGSPLSDAYHADVIKLAGKWKKSKDNQLTWDFGYRELKVLESSLTDNKSARNLMTNINYQFKAYKKAIKSNTNYQIGIGQEPKLEYVFEKVQEGEGNYIWIDYNEDEVEQIDEFINARELDQDIANYIKIPVFNNEFVSTNTIQFSQNLRIDPGLYIGSSEKNKWMKKWSTVTNIRYKQKQVVAAENDIIPFFEFDIVDSLVFSHIGSINNTVFYNKGNPKFDFQLGQNLRTNKLALVTGFEVINSKLYYIRNRINLWNTTDLINKYSYGTRGRKSENFENRAYDILSHLISTTVSYRPKPSLRFNLTGEYDQRKNQIMNASTLAKSKKIGLNINAKLSKISNIIADVKFVNVEYDGMVNTPLHTVMLEGLNNGNNYIWSVFYNRKMWKNLFLTLRYSGRKTGDVRAIHIANVQLKASF